MRILFVTTSPLGQIGGAAKYYMPSYLAKLGHEVALAVPAGGRAESVLDEADVAVMTTPSRSVYGRMALLRATMRSFDPDIVHVFFHRYCGLYPRLLGRFNRARWVMDVRSPLLTRGVEAYLKRLLNRCEARGYDHVISPSLESLQTVLGPGYPEASVVPMGVEISSIRDRQRRVADAGDRWAPMRRAVYIGSLNRIRRLEEMIRAIKEASRRVPLVVDVYGEGDGLPQFREAVQREGLARTVRLQGVRPRRDLYELLADYDIGLAYIGNPLHDTAPPLKTLEYLAAGLPVVGTDTAGNRWFVQPPVNGILTDMDHGSFADGIVELARSSRFESMSAAARDSVRGFDWQTVVRTRLMPVYQRLAQGRPCSPTRY